MHPSFVTDKGVESTFFTLAFFNSLVNPFIYFAHFRKMLLDRFYRIIGRKQQSSTLQVPRIQEGISSTPLTPQIIINSNLNENTMITDYSKDANKLEPPKERVDSLIPKDVMLLPG